MAFGFSVGDVIAGTNLLITSINAIKDSTGASSEYRAVSATLRQTCAALEGLNDLHLAEAAHREALEVAASQCGTTIFQFVNKISKFKGSLGQEKDVKNWRGVLRKLEWSLYSKDDVRRFQAQLQGDLLTLQTTLGRVHLAVTLAGLQEAQSALIRVETRLDQAAATRLLIMRALSRCFEEFRGLLIFAFYTNMRLINALLSSSERSPQVQEERPIYLDDPHGRIIPIPRSWIEDWDDFEALLKIQFKRVPGLKKILNRKYLLKDAASSAEISQSAAIDFVFVPGRKIIMSMVFTTHPQSSSSRCPKCFQSSKSTHNANAEPQCISCGTNYSTSRLTRKEVKTVLYTTGATLPIRRFEGWIASSEQSPSPYIILASPSAPKKRVRQLLNPSRPTDATGQFFPTEYVEDFSRVHIVEIPHKRRDHLTAEWISMLNSLNVDPSITGEEGDDSVMKKLRSYETSEYINTEKLLENLLELDPDHGFVHAKREFSRAFVASNLDEAWTKLNEKINSHWPMAFVNHFPFSFSERPLRHLDSLGLGGFEDLLRDITLNVNSEFSDRWEYSEIVQEADQLVDHWRKGTQILSDLFDISFEVLPKLKERISAETFLRLQHIDTMQLML